MLAKLTEIAPLSTWALTLAAGALLLCGFVTLGHAKLVRQAYEAEYHGVLAPHAMETMSRWTVALLSGGLLLWGVSLHWSVVILGVLGAVAAVALLLEGIARVRGA